MIVTARTRKSKAKSGRRNDKFLRMLPAIREQAQFAFRTLPLEAREEQVQEVVATAYGMFHRLASKGKMNLAYATPLAQFAIRHVHSGRRMGSRHNIRDLTSRGDCPRNGIVIRPLHRFNARTGEWREVLVEDRSAGPAETAAARIDWVAWLHCLPRRRRAIACILASGETTGAAARKFRIGAARISQLRSWFRANWEQFHEEPPSGSRACSRRSEC